MSESSIFKLKHFVLKQRKDVFKIGTDAMVLGAWVSINPDPERILDLGSGTGVLSLMLAQKYPEAQIVALDSNPAAVALAQENFECNDIGKNCSVVSGTFSNFNAEAGFDLVVSNPPYFLNAKVASGKVNASAKHIDLEGLMEFFACISRNLNHTGHVALVHPLDSRFELFAAEFGFFVTRKLELYGVEGKLVRLCNVYSKEPNETRVESLVVRDKHGSYTQQYKGLTKDFHGVDL